MVPLSYIKVTKIKSLITLKIVNGNLRRVYFAVLQDGSAIKVYDDYKVMPTRLQAVIKSTTKN